MKLFKRIISAVLVITLAVLTPLNVSAASPRYISGVTVCYASDFAEAKAELKELGYEIVENGNLNATLGTGVYLGYQTTDDPDEALTDIAAMNMLGNYSYSDYDKLMEKHRGLIGETVRNFETALAGFQTNFYSGMPEAQLAYDSINLYREDDSGKLMGDYLLDYDFSEEAQKELTETIMQANTEIVMSIMQNVAMASDTEEKTLFDRMSLSDPDKLVESYIGLYLSPAQALAAMESDFSATAAALRLWWNDFYGYLEDVADEAFETDGDGKYVLKEDALGAEETPDADLSGLSEDEKEVVELYSEAAGAAELRTAAEDIALFILLDSTTCSNGTMLDFFMRPLKEVGTYELYALANAMSESQRAQLSILGIRTTLLGACVKPDADSDETRAEVEDNTNEMAQYEPISIYRDMDRSVFEDGVALTGSAVRHEQQDGKTWLEALIGGSISKSELKTAAIYTGVVAGGAFFSGVISAVVQKIRQSGRVGTRFEVAAETLNSARNEYQAIKEQSIVIRDVENYGDVYISNSPQLSAAKAQLNKATSLYEESRTAYDAAGRSARIAKYVSFAVFVIAVIIDVVLIYEFCTKEAPAEERIPHHLLAALDAGYGEDYVYYETVKDQNGDPADVNHREGEVGWLVLYQTREKNAGKPILAADLRVKTGSRTVEEDSGYIHLFDQTGALNLTDPAYTGKNDTVGGTVVLFDRDSNAYAGSAISGGIAALFAVGGAVVGFCGGYLLKGLKKKKERA